MAAVVTFDVDETTIAEVVRFAFSTTSNPTAAEVQNIVGRIAARVNGALAVNGFDPALITSATATQTSYRICRDAVIAGATADVLRAIDSADTELARSWDKKFEAILTDIRENPESLSDAYSRATQPGQGRSHFEDANFTDASGILTGHTSATPIFTETDKW